MHVLCCKHALASFSVLFFLPSAFAYSIATAADVQTFVDGCVAVFTEQGPGVFGVVKPDHGVAQGLCLVDGAQPGLEQSGGDNRTRPRKNVPF